MEEEEKRYMLLRFIDTCLIFSEFTHNAAGLISFSLGGELYSFLISLSITTIDSIAYPSAKLSDNQMIAGV